MSLAGIDRLDTVGPFPHPVWEWDVPAGNIKWYEGERVGMDPATGIAWPLAPGYVPIGECITTRDLTVPAAGVERIKVKSGAYEIAQDGTIADDASINTPVYYNPTTNLATGADGGGTNAFMGPLVRSLTTPGGLRVVKVDFRPQNVLSAGAGRVVTLTKTITHADLTAAATSQAITIGIAPGRFIGGSKTLTANFTGGGATAVLLDVGGTDPDGLIADDDVLAGPLAEDFAPLGAQVVNAFHPTLTGQTITATFTADVNVVALTAGSVTLRLDFLLG